MALRGFALHTWTLDTTPLAELLAIARRTGWDAVELRRVDFDRAAQAGVSAEDVLARVRASGLPVAAVGVELGWMFAEGDERRRLLGVFAESCRWAADLGCGIVMSPVDPAGSDLTRAAASVREVGDLAAEHGVRLALEFLARAEAFNTAERTRELLARADHSSCGLLVDTYQVACSGGGLRVYEDLQPGEVAYVQYSDAPPGPVQPGPALDRLPPGQGTIPFPDVFRLLAGTGYDGYASYEAPNPDTWARDPEAVAREVLAATRRVVGTQEAS